MDFTEYSADNPTHKVSIKGDFSDIKDPSDVKIVQISTKHGRNGVLSSIRAFFVAVFLPQGFPSSVSPDYLEYQLWDTIQAFASSMTCALATEAVLKGAGVGSEAATALAASMTWLVKDGLGMLGRIAFTYAKGTELDYDCKRWRLMADILNDASFFVDLLSPYSPGLFFPCACISSLFRCVVGVAGGATRATIVQHQARCNNLADVAAKDGSQETLVNVIALVASLILLPLVSGKTTVIWCCFALFTFTHLYANYRAVRSLNIDTFNRKRAVIAIRAYCSDGRVPSVEEVNSAEPLFSSLTGVRRFGCSLSQLLRANDSGPIKRIADGAAIIRYGDSPSSSGYIAVHRDALPSVHLLSVFLLESSGGHKPSESCEKKKIVLSYPDFLDKMKEQGWKTDVYHLGFQDYTFEEK